MNQLSLDHPSAEQLSAFGLGQLDESASATIVEHLTVCEPCRHVVDGVAPDSLVDLLKRDSRQPFSDETLTLTLRMGKDSLRMAGPFSLDARKEPKRITFIIQQTPKDQKGAASNTGVHGIYRFDGDRLVLCITEGADRRPSEFATSKQTPDQFLLTLVSGP